MRTGQLFRKKNSWLGRLRACPDCTCRFSFPEAAGHWLCCTCRGPAPASPHIPGCWCRPWPAPHPAACDSIACCALPNSLLRPACHSHTHLPMFWNHVAMKGIEKQPPCAFPSLSQAMVKACLSLSDLSVSSFPDYGVCRSKLV
jgi:hypothetical protein